MSELNRKLLRDSVDHWEENVERVKRGDLPDTRSSECALCREYNWGDRHCEGCPVYEHTGWLYCRSTPFQRVEAWRCLAIDAPASESDSIWDNLLRACQDELKLLNKLLEEENPNG